MKFHQFYVMPNDFFDVAKLWLTFLLYCFSLRGHKSKDAQESYKTTSYLSKELMSSNHPSGTTNHYKLRHRTEQAVCHLNFCFCLWMHKWSIGIFLHPTWHEHGEFWRPNNEMNHLSNLHGIRFLQLQKIEIQIII